MSALRRIQVRLGPALSVAVDSFAEDRGLPVSAALRVLVRAGLESVARDAQTVGQPAAALAALVAAEHAALMVAAILPDGRRLMQDLATEAASAAEERLAMFRQAER